MNEVGLHPGLDSRLAALAKRIADLGQKMNQEKGVAKIEELSQIKELERRHKMLEDQLIELNGEGPGVQQDLKAGIETLADDLSGAVEDFFLWIDSNYHPDRRPKALRKS